MKQQKISIVALTLLITGAIDSIRNLPATALFGTQLIAFFILAALFFLIPVALVAAELASTFVDEEGGIFHWVHLALGEEAACIAVWLQWINTLVWFPTILSFIAGTVAYLIYPPLAGNKFFLTLTSISLFWGLTLLNLKGLKTSANFASFCAIVGMIFPMLLIISLAIYWVATHHPIALTFTKQSLIPHVKDSRAWVSLTAMVSSFLGMELAAVHVKQVRNPKKSFPIAMLLSVILILFTMIFGSLAIAFVIPNHQIHLVDGVMQAYQFFFNAFHLSYLLKPLGVLIVIGSLGGMINWIISPTKGLFLVANHGFLPPFFTKHNKHDAASSILCLQAVIVSAIALLFLIAPSINEIYWFLTALSTELYMFMYLMMFAAAIAIRKQNRSQTGFHIPGKRFGFYLVTVMGLIGVTITCIIGFIPPSDAVNILHPWLYSCYFALGLLVMLAPSTLLLRYKRRNER